MDNILVRLNPKLKAQIQKIRKYANNRFHVIAAESGTELKKVGVGELNSVKLGLYSAKGLEVGHVLISGWISKAGLSENIKYLNGVLFLDVKPIEAETIEAEPVEEETEDLDEFGIWDGIEDEL